MMPNTCLSRIDPRDRLILVDFLMVNVLAIATWSTDALSVRHIAKRIEDRYTTAADFAKELAAAMSVPATPAITGDQTAGTASPPASAGTYQPANVHVAVQLGSPQAVAGSVREPRYDPTKYLRALLDATQYIDIRGLQVGAGKAYRFPIEDMFITLTSIVEAVATRAGPAAASKRDTTEGIDYKRQKWLHEALVHRRVVIVGDPGSGKTTFSRRVASSLCQVLLGQNREAANDRLGISDQPFPLFIRLAELVEHISLSRRRQGSSLPTTAESPAWFPHFLAASSTESNQGLDDDFFRSKLDSGDAILLLDGLDEAPSRAARITLSRLIENAARVYDRCRVVVTSRPGSIHRRDHAHGLRSCVHRAACKSADSAGSRAKPIGSKAIPAQLRTSVLRSFNDAINCGTAAVAFTPIWLMAQASSARTVLSEFVRLAVCRWTLIEWSNASD
jgi:hypothetical protein